LCRPVHCGLAPHLSRSVRAARHVEGLAGMTVDPFERMWMWSASGMLALFLAAIVASAVTGAAHPASHVETVDPETLSIKGEFAEPAVALNVDGSVRVPVRAEFFVFRPSTIRVPAGRPVTFRVTSAD